MRMNNNLQCADPLDRIPASRPGNRCSGGIDDGAAMIFIFDNGKTYSDHALYFVEAPADFEQWFNSVYRPWVDGTEDRPMMIVAVADKVERRERLPFTLETPTSNVGKLWAEAQSEMPPYEFATIPVTKFLKREAVMQERDGKPRPRYRLEVE